MARYGRTFPIRAHTLRFRAGLVKPHTQYFVQALPTGKSSSGTGAVTTSAFGLTTTTGNHIALVIGDDSGLAATGITSVTDSYGNTYTKAVGDAGTTALSIWHAKNITGGASHTITINWNLVTTSKVSYAGQESSGLNTTAPLDVTASSSTGSPSATISSGTTAATSMASELVIVAGSWQDATVTASEGTGYTDLSGNNGLTLAMMAMESKAVTTTGTQSGTLPLRASTNWIGVIATFKAAGGGPPVNTTNFFAMFN